MSSRRLLVLALLVLPVVALAQRPKERGTKPPDLDKLAAGDRRAGLQLSNKDVEGMSPIKLLIDKRKDLALTDDQLKGLKDLDAALKTRNESLFKQLDSLRQEMKPTDASPEVEALRTKTVRNSVAGVVTGIRNNQDAAGNEAMPLLGEPQQKPAQALLDKQRTESDETLKEKLGGRRGG